MDRCTFTFAGARATTAPPPVIRPGPPDVDQLTSPILRHGAGQAGEVLDRELLPARLRVDAGGPQPGLRRRPRPPPPGPARGASAERRLLRRMAKAASTTAKVATRSPGGGGRRSSATSPESTFGS